MATYADLKTRIIDEMKRDDLTDESAALLATHIYDACEEYADRKFWFNLSVQSLSTVANVQTVSVPGGMRIIDRVAGPYADLTPFNIDDLIDWGVNPQTGLPSAYAYYNNALRFNVTPDAVYAMTVYGILQVDPPTADNDSNIWTNEAQALISAQARMTLNRDLFRDAEGEAAAARAVQSHLTKLNRETERRTRTRPYARLVAPNGRPVRSNFLDRF